MSNTPHRPEKDRTPGSGTGPGSESSPTTGAAAPPPSGGAVGATNATSVKRTRTAGAWVGLVAGALILILLLVFIVQNGESQEVSILFWSFSLPLGVSMLFAAIAGALVMALAGGARIMQLRKEYRRKPPRR